MRSRVLWPETDVACAMIASESGRKDVFVALQVVLHFFTRFHAIDNRKILLCVEFKCGIYLHRRVKQCQRLYSRPQIY